jgi:folate-binding protein YgfZ
MKVGHDLVADRSERAKLRIGGDKRLWFLHQQLTQAFEDVTPGTSRDAALITVHGRMRAYLETIATEDAVLCHFEPELRTSLPEELGRFAPLVPVEIEDVTSKWGLVLVAGPSWQRVAELCPSALVHETASLGVPAAYLWLPSASVAESIELLCRHDFEEASEERLEALRIAHCVPRWGREMDFKTFPQEVGIDNRAVHYEKGCYLGQEAMAKIHFRGRVNRRLARLESEQSLVVGAEVMLDSSKVGVVTSGSGGRALALVRATVEAGAEVTVAGAQVVVDPQEKGE